MASDEELIAGLRHGLEPLRPRPDLAAVVIAAVAVEPPSVRGWMRAGAIGKPLARLLRIQRWTVAFAAAGAVALAVVAVFVAGHRPSATTLRAGSDTTQLAELRGALGVLRAAHPQLTGRQLATLGPRVSYPLAVRRLDGRAREWLSVGTTQGAALGAPAHSVGLFVSPSASSCSCGLLGTVAAGDRVRIDPVSVDEGSVQILAELVPDGVTRVRWTFASRGQAVLTASVAVKDNLAADRLLPAALLADGSSKVRSVTWLGSGGLVLKRFDHPSPGASTPLRSERAPRRTYTYANGSELTLTPRGIGAVRFGQTSAAVRTLLTTRLGTPRSARVGAAGCGVTTELSWPHDASDRRPSHQSFEAFFTHGKLVGYQDNVAAARPSGTHRTTRFQTAKGLRVGDTLAVGRKLYGKTFHISGAQDGSFWIGPRMAQVLDGYIYHWHYGSLAGKVATLDAGLVGCPAASP